MGWAHLIYAICMHRWEPFNIFAHFLIGGGPLNDYWVPDSPTLYFSGPINFRGPIKF